MNLFISTMPRSGTWFLHYFFWCYRKRLRNQDFELNANIHCAPSMGLDNFRIGHGILPGFRDTKESRGKWSKLEFHTMGYSHAENDEFNFHDNKNNRIVYIYRNPLDQAISYYNHSKDHKDIGTRSIIDGKGNRIIAESPEQFLELCGLESYLKQWITFYFYKDIENLMRIPYEIFFRNKGRSLKKIMDFINHKIDEKSFEYSLKYCTKENLKNVEIQQGHTLANDQKTMNSHIRSGEVGKWKEIFGDKILGKTVDFFKKFDIDFYEEFIIE